MLAASSTGLRRCAALLAWVSAVGQVLAEPSYQRFRPTTLILGGLTAAAVTLAPDGVRFGWATLGFRRCCGLVGGFVALACSQTSFVSRQLPTLRGPFAAPAPLACAVAFCVGLLLVAVNLSGTGVPGRAAVLTSLTGAAFAIGVLGDYELALLALSGNHHTALVACACATLMLPTVAPRQPRLPRTTPPGAGPRLDAGFRITWRRHHTRQTLKGRGDSLRLSRETRSPHVS